MTENIVTTLVAEDYVNPGPDPWHDPHHPPAIDVSISLGSMSDHPLVICSLLSHRSLLNIACLIIEEPRS